MKWLKKYIYERQYEWASSNQHGERFKRDADKQIVVARLSCICVNADDLQTLICLGHTLDVPVRYDFDASPQFAYIEVIGKESL